MNTLLPYFVYILFSQKDHLLYIGYSSNLEKRVSDHNNGNTKSTAHRRPLQLIFCEGYLYKEDAMKREGYFKTTAGKKAIRYMLTSTLLTLGYQPLLHNLSFEFDNQES
jgi:putative endonuclease